MSADSYVHPRRARGVEALQRAVRLALATPGSAADLEWWLASTAYLPEPDRDPPRGGRTLHLADDEVGDRRVVALVRLAQGGDAEAFGQLYDLHVDGIHRFLLARLRDRQLAEDLTSETFLRALRSIGSFRWKGRRFAAWLTTIARNLVADHYKSSRSRLEVVADELPERVDDEQQPDARVLAAWSSEALVSALDTLPPEQRDCLVMRFFQGLSIADTAAALGRSDGAVKQLQLRAVRALARRLDGVAR